MAVLTFALRTIRVQVKCTLEYAPGRMLRLTAMIALMYTATGCSWQQAYFATQEWQRSQCNRLPEETERKQCLARNSMSYDDYRRQTEGTKRE